MINKKQVVICLECPLACRIMVELNDIGEIISIKGNECPIGESHAKNEIIDPKRVLTTTVFIDSKDKDHCLLPVQTRGPIGLDLLEETMKELAEIILEPPIKYGEIIKENILNSGVDIIATDECME